MNLFELIEFFLHNGIECDEDDWKCLNDVLGDIENLENVSRFVNATAVVPAYRLLDVKYMKLIRNSLHKYNRSFIDRVAHEHRYVVKIKSLMRTLR